jgi:transcriptional regulator with XRE-family HTH domain
MVSNDRLNLLLAKNHISKTHFSAALGLSSPALSHYISGNRRPSYDIIAKMAGLLNVSTDYLLALTNDPTPSPDQAEMLLSQYNFDVKTVREENKIVIYRT